MLAGILGEPQMRKYRDYLVEELADYEEAASFFQVVLEEYEKDPDNLALLLDLESIIEAQGEESNLAPEIFLLRGLVRHSLKEYHNAVEDYNTALNLNPADSMAYVYRALAYYQSGDKDGALQNFDKACYSLWSTQYPWFGGAGDYSRTGTVLYESAASSAPKEENLTDNVTREIARRVMNPPDTERDSSIQNA